MNLEIKMYCIILNMVKHINLMILMQHIIHNLYAKENGSGVNTDTIKQME